MGPYFDGFKLINMKSLNSLHFSKRTALCFSVLVKRMITDGHNTFLRYEFSREIMADVRRGDGTGFIVEHPSNLLVASILLKYSLWKVRV